MKTDISIILPVYNVEEYLEECLESLIAQTYGNFEVIAVNDGSKDNSLNILKRYEDKFEKIKIINQENRGLSAARNTGLEHSQGEYVLFLDSDDMLKENALEKLFFMAKNKNLDLIVYDALAFDEVTGKQSLKKYSRKNIYSNSIMDLEDFLEGECKKYISLSQLHFYKSSVIKDNCLKFKEGLLHEDTHFSIISYNYVKRIGYLDEMLYLRRYRPNSIMTGNLYKNNKSLESYLWIINDFKNIKSTNTLYNNLISEHSSLLLSNLIRYKNMTLSKLIKISKKAEVKLDYIRVFLNLILFKLIRR